MNEPRPILLLVMSSLVAGAPACSSRASMSAEEAPNPSPTMTAPEEPEPAVEVEVSIITDETLEEKKDEPNRKLGKGAPDAPRGDGPAPPPPPPPPIQAATTETVNGAVDPASIQRSVANQRALFGRCLRVDASIELEATIAPSGRVIDAKSTKSVPDEPKLRDCLVDAFKRLTIEPHTSPSPARVKFALALRRPGH